MTVRTLILCENEFEDLELWYPKIRLAEAQVHVTIAGPKAGTQLRGKHGLTCTPDIAFDDVDIDDYDALFIPGGHAPDKLRTHRRVLEIVREFNDSGKPIGLICHAGEVAVDAGIVKDREVTGHRAIQQQLINAGAIWRDDPVVIDDNLLSSRTPADLPQFGKALVDHVRQHQATASSSRA